MTTDIHARLIAPNLFKHENGILVLNDVSLVDKGSLVTPGIFEIVLRSGTRVVLDLSLFDEVMGALEEYHVAQHREKSRP
jgi:hypothetical protein